MPLRTEVPVRAASGEIPQLMTFGTSKLNDIAMSKAP